MKHRAALIIVAAGQGQRFGSPDKVLAEVGGVPALSILFDTVRTVSAIDAVVVVTSERCLERVRELVIDPTWRVVLGGERRQDSVAAGLAQVGVAEIVAVHDGARPFAGALMFTAGIAAVADGADAAIAATPLTDTLKRVSGGRVVETLDRAAFALAQTPQVFRRAALTSALVSAEERGLTVTDEATLIEELGGIVAVVPGAVANLKLTNPEDLAVAEGVAASKRANRAPVVRTGIGYDVHRLVAGRRLVLGGVEIPFERGLDGHSDADVLLHAVADALLGAAALGDIGGHFPPTDPSYKDADSLGLLASVRGLLRGAGYEIVNVDATVIAEAPRLMPYVEAMRSAIAGALLIEPEQFGVKATTNEGMGFPGRGEGIAALAVATVSVAG